jgi:hypothetical protein
VKKIVAAGAIVIPLTIVVSLVAVRYSGNGEERLDSRSLLPETGIAEPETASIPELMDSLNIYRVEEPWEAPDFELASLQGSKGGLREHRGNHVLLTFWTTW